MGCFASKISVILVFLPWGKWWLEIKGNYNEGISICFATLTHHFYMPFLTKRAEIFLILFDYTLTKTEDTNCDPAQFWSIIKKRAFKHVDWKTSVIEIFNYVTSQPTTWDSIIDTGKFVSMLHGKNCLNVRQGMAAGYSYPGNFENLISYNEVKTNLLG